MVGYMDQRSSLLPLELLPGVGSHSLLVHLLHLTWELSFDDETIVLLGPSVSMTWSQPGDITPQVVLCPNLVPKG